MVTAFLLIANALNEIAFGIKKKEGSWGSELFTIILLVFTTTLDLMLFFRIYSYLGR